MECIRRFNLIFLIGSVANVTSEKIHLEMVQVLFRHGDRTPDLVEIPKDDPYTPIFAKIGYGRLTKIGMQRAHKFGQMLRERYGDFIGYDDVDDVYPYSTPQHRTKTSLMLALAGLFPITNETTWDSQLNWLPVPINYDPADSNFLWNVYHGKCQANFWRSVSDAGDSVEIKEKMRNYQAFLDDLKNKTGLPIAAFIYNYLQAIRSMGLPLPRWCSSDQDFERLSNLTSTLNEALTFTPHLRMKTGGLFLKKFLQNIHDTSDLKKKLYLYSANDLQIMAINQMLQFENVPSIPDYSSALIIEKYREKGIELLRMFMWTGVSRKMIPLRIRGCKHECPLAIFEEVLSHFYPKNEDEAC